MYFLFIICSVSARIAIMLMIELNHNDSKIEFGLAGLVGFSGFDLFWDCSFIYLPLFDDYKTNNKMPPIIRMIPAARNITAKFFSV